MSPNNDSLNEQSSPEKDESGAAASETRVAGHSGPSPEQKPRKKRRALL